MKDFLNIKEILFVFKNFHPQNLLQTIKYLKINNKFTVKISCGGIQGHNFKYNFFEYVVMVRL